MPEQTVNPTLGWSWSGLALGPIALVQHGLWRVFLISVVSLLAIFAIATAMAHIPQTPMRRELLPLIIVSVLVLYHFLVASSLSRWRMHRYLHERLEQQGGSVAATGIAGQRLQSNLALMRHRAETTLETSAADAVGSQGEPTLTQTQTTIEMSTQSDDRIEQAIKTAFADGSVASRPDSASTDDFENVPDHFFARALDELRTDDASNRHRRDETAWHQATTIHADNLDLARSFYIRIRVKQFMRSNPLRGQEITAGRNLQRANSRRMARLRAYESYVEKVFKNVPAPTVSVASGGSEATSSGLPYTQDRSTLSIVQINALLSRARLSLSSTQANGYVVRNQAQDTMEIDSHQELEQFLQILSKKMAKYDVE